MKWQIISIFTQRTKSNTTTKATHMKYSFKGSLGRITHQVSRDLGRHLEDKFQEAGYPVNMYEWTVLSYLTEHHQSCQKDIAHFLGTDKVMVKRIVDGLEKKGFVVRQEDPHDKRFNQVVITQAGGQLFASLEPFAEGVLKDAYLNISDASIHQCLNTLQEIAVNLDRDHMR